MNMLLICALTLLLILLYIYTTKNHSYWSRRKVKHDPPLPFFGNHLPNLLVKRSVAEIGIEMYNKYTGEKMVGYYRGSTPELIIRNPEIAKRILDADFMHFFSRGGLDNPRKVPLMHNLIFVDGDQWNLLRKITLSAFSTGKLRAMFPLVIKCTENFLERTDKLIARGDVVDAFELMTIFTTDFVCSCGLGVELDTIGSKLSRLSQVARNVFDKSKWQAFTVALEELFPELKWVQWPRVSELKVAKLILDIMKKVRKQKLENGSYRNDYMDSMIEIEARGPIRLQSIFEKNLDGSSKEVELEMDLQCAAAQVFVFLMIGHESSAAVSSFTLHQLAYHPVIQHKIQQEIDMVLPKYNNKLCYDAIEELSYLNMVLKESLRIFSPFGYIKRKCTKRYTIPGTSVTIDPGVRVLIPNQAIHMDPKYFDDPNEFRPERFSQAFGDESKCLYLPYGGGPRKCPAGHLVEMQILAGLAALLRRYTVVVAPLSKRQHHVTKSSYLMQVIDGPMPIRLVKRNDVSF